MKSFLKILLIVFVLFFSEIVYSQINSDTLIFSKENILFLKTSLMIDSVFSVKLNTLPLGNDNYQIDKVRSKIILNNNLNLDTLNIIIIQYSTLPINKNYLSKKNTLIIYQDSVFTDSFRTISAFSLNDFTKDIFSRNLQKSGTLYRGFTMGTNRDLRINSGLRLQLSGNLTEDLEVVAALTDENSPLQPEGTTRNIQEINNVFIQLKHTLGSITFGDLFFENNTGEFGNLSRKISGLNLNGRYKKNEINFAYATSKGKYNIQTFNGIDGIQGPYRLSGKNGERDIIVLAGTEKVYINGELVTRGENYDYTIDYGLSEITFTIKKQMRNDKRITVEFEYTDRKYQRNFLGFSGNSSIFDDKVKINLSYYREGDDIKTTFDIDLNDSDKTIIGNSGKDYLKSSKSGISYVGIDSLGKPLGLYVKKDSTINNTNIIYYVYNPLNDFALYNINFSYVGANAGDYIREGLGVFKFVGKNNGNYLPIILLPIPELNQIFNIQTDLQISRNLSSSLEFSASNYNQNLFSSDPRISLNGYAYKIKINYDSLKISLGDFNIGTYKLSFSERYLNDNYFSSFRINSVEFHREWNTFETENNQPEKIREFYLKRYLSDFFGLNLIYGLLERNNIYKTNRIINELIFSPIKNVELIQNNSFIRTKENNYSSDWDKYFTTLSLNFSFIKNKLLIEFEDKKDFYPDSILSSSFKFLDIKNVTETKLSSNISLNTEYSFRKEFNLVNNTLEENNNSNMILLNLNLNKFLNQIASLYFSYRIKKFTENFKKKGNLDNSSVAIKLLTRGSYFDNILNTEVNYEGSSQYTARYEKLFIKVPKGTGDYVYIGDINKNGLIDEFDFLYDKLEGEYIIQTYPTESLFPVTDLKTSFRIKTNFEKLSEKYLNFLSTETYIRIEEVNKDPISEDILLLKFSKFLNKDNTIRGIQFFQQDLFFFQNKSDINLRLRLSERRAYTQFSLQNENRFTQEKSFSIKVKLTDEITNVSDYVNLKDALSTTPISKRDFDLRTNKYKNKLNYFPYSNTEINFIIEYISGINYQSSGQNNISINSEDISIAYAISEKGRITTSFQRFELKIKNPDNYIPFELIGSNLPGNNWIWRTNFDYRLSANIISTVYYEGRFRQDEKIFHNARAEIRAFF